MPAMRPKSVAASRRAPALRVLVPRLLAPCVLALGYADLARGGVTAGPLLLAAGYLVLVPAVMLES